MFGEDKENIEEVIKKFEEDKVIVKYYIIINWEKIEKEVVEVIVEVKVIFQ